MSHPTPDFSRLPDGTSVVASSPMLPDQKMTLGEACSKWRDARHFGIDYALRTKGEWRAQMLTIRLEA